MYKMLYFGIGLLFGGGIGATTAYILTKKRLEDEKEKEIIEMREYFLKKAEEVLTGNNKTTKSYETEFVTGMSIKDEKAATDGPVKYTTFPEEFKKPDLEDIAKEKGYFNYSNLSAETEYPQEDTGEGENLAHPSDLYLITEEQYLEECLNYEKREFRYYKEDQILCNEEDEVLTIRYCVGEDAIKKLDTEDLVYVRNDILHIDYEVQGMEGSYDEQVLGHYTED